MKKYNFVNNLTGWLVFAVAAFTYCATVEPTASFWDCPEFILSANKLEVGHPPGAPFFMLTANLFSTFAEPQNVARMVNYMSALLSAGAILFLFWSITHLAKKMICGKGEALSAYQLIAIMGSGVVGALAYTWSDTFWFSAVEGEVYGYSSFFTAVVFWLILKWENVADQPHSDRWLVLIAYLTGLSIGVHLLNLLCLPAIVLVAYFKKSKSPTLKGSVWALLFSMVLVAAVLYGIVPGIVKVGGWFELLFVNGMGLPFNSGLVVYIILLAAALIWGVYESHMQRSKRRMNIAFLLSVGLMGIPFYGHGVGSVLLGVVVLLLLAALLFYGFKSFKPSARLLNTSLLCLLTIVMGYSSYALIVIRSTANTPMDQNSPEDIFTLGEYLGREQYGTRPLFYGQSYASEVSYVPDGSRYVAEMKSGAPVYARKEKATPDEKDSYLLVRNKDEYVYAQNMLFPRMYSRQHANYPGYGNLYADWVNIEGRTVNYNRAGQTMQLTVPTQWENLQFFVNYQLNYMYWRYFLWNFVGRQNDLQGQGEIEHGNWITGIPFIDNLLVGDQSTLPDELKNNKGHNVFYALPLILGIIGLVWQVNRGRRGKQQFWVVFFLFFMTGLAIVLYLNQTPLQPRERDYAYAGSFYAFAIWIGLGVAALADWAGKKMGRRPAWLAAAVSLLCLMVPLQMVSQTWDDHDRSGRYTCRDFGQNYLMTLPDEGNPIIYTCGDNDTFPLWYNQEVEGVRTDARVCNLSYLQTDWYIDQMRRDAYDSPALPIDWQRIEYVEGTNDYAEVAPEAKDILLTRNPQYSKEEIFSVKNMLRFAREHQIIPTDTLYIPVDSAAVRASGMMVPAEYEGENFPKYMAVSIKGKRMLIKKELMIFEMLANANWVRPIYMSTTVGSENYPGGLKSFFVQEGLACRITPFNYEAIGYSSSSSEYPLDSEKMYDNLVNRFKFGGLDNPGFYVDEQIQRMSYTHRRMFSQLAATLIKEGKNDKARIVLDKCEKEIPAYTVPHASQCYSGEMARSYIILGEYEKAKEILEAVAGTHVQYLQWYNTFSDKRFRSLSAEASRNLYWLRQAIMVMNDGGEPLQEMNDRYTALFGQLYSQVAQRE